VRVSTSTFQINRECINDQNGAFVGHAIGSSRFPCRGAGLLRPPLRARFCWPAERPYDEGTRIGAAVDLLSLSVHCSLVTGYCSLDYWLLDSSPLNCVGPPPGRWYSFCGPACRC